LGLSFFFGTEATGGKAGSIAGEDAAEKLAELLVSVRSRLRVKKEWQIADETLYSMWIQMILQLSFLLSALYYHIEVLADNLQNTQTRLCGIA